jgi:predicted dehydrogenase
VVQYSGGTVPGFGGPWGEEQTMEIIPPSFGDASNPLNQHRAFLEAARDGRPAPVSIASAVHDLAVVTAVYESVRKGETCFSLSGERSSPGAES